MNAKQYALALRTTQFRQSGPVEGLKNARRIAARCKAASAPATWNDLPLTGVFGRATSKAMVQDTSKIKYVLNDRALKETYNFWCEVDGILRKAQ